MVGVSPAVPPAQLTPVSIAPVSIARETRSSRTAAAFALLGETVLLTERQALREHIVLLNAGVARSLAQRFRLRGVESEDLEQVAYAGLVRSVRRFDPAPGHDFLSYAVPTIRGEIKRHFRDNSWTIRVPRRIQETQAELTSADPSVDSLVRCSDTRLDELAAAVRRPRAEVVDALAARGCFRPTSLDVPVVGDRVGAGLEVAVDDWVSATETRVMLAPLVGGLSPRDQRIVRLRYVDELSQTAIGAELGISKMQVSRLLARIHRTLRLELTGG